MKKLSMDELNRMTVDEFRMSEKVPLLIILDNIRSQHNIGSIFRTADAFRLQGLLLCGITATPPHREIHKSALGATESVDWKYFPQTMEALEYAKGSGYRLIALEQAEGSIKLDQATWDKDAKIAIIVGNEINGIDQEIIDRCDSVIEIPQFGTKHSLNVSVSVGIVIWEAVSAGKIISKL